MNPISYKNVSTAITKMTKADALAPIAGLEAVVVAGRTYQAYKRGKLDEARERFIEETSGSIVWLCGVGAMNKLGDKLVNKILRTQKQNFDVGTDKLLRTPFENFMKKVAPRGFSPKQVALLKGAKVLASVVLTNLFIGFAVPIFNQSLTRSIKRKEKEKGHSQQNNPAFKGGGLNAINAFTNAIENTNTGKLLSSDAGIAGGRMYNARTKEERREIAIRDIGSIYFYMWAQGHVRNILNLIETGKATRLNPSTTGILTKHLTNFIGDNSMSVEEFRKAVLGEKNPENKYYDKFNQAFKKENLSWFEKITKQQPLEVARVFDIEQLANSNDFEFLERVREMSKLQPPRTGDAVITKQQFFDAINKAEINRPRFLDKVFTEFTDGASKDEFKYVSNKKLYKLKSEMENYVESICKSAKDGKISKELLRKIEKKNLIYSGINFVAGFAVAATFLSTIIPKIQYWYTRKTTGVNAFPGLYDYNENKKT